MGSIIVAMPRYDDAGRIAEIFKRSDIWENVRIVKQGSEILLTVENEDVDLVVCTGRLSDMGYEELSEYLPSGVNIILLTSDAGLIPFSSNIVKLLMPFKPGDLISTAKMLLPYGGYRVSKKKAERSPGEQKLIDHAKKLLMDNNEMSEPEAFKYIQKSSMDSGRTMAETASMIIMLANEYE